MDVQDLHSPNPSSRPSISGSSKSNCVRQLSISARRWHVAQKTAHRILSVIQPSVESEKRREQIIGYLQALIEDAFGIKVFLFGSVPLKTYLPHGDIDLIAVDHSSSVEDLSSKIFTFLENESKNNSRFQVKDVVSVPAQVKVVKCTVSGICVDISFNQTNGLCALYFLEQVDRFIGKDHLFKRSLILIKAWCYYESRILGALYGLISTYALEIMVLHVMNLFHSSLQCPIAVLYKFLEYYSTFDWDSYCVGINGLVVISSLPNIVVERPPNCNDLLMSDAFIRSSRDAILSSMGIVSPNISSFPKKFLNILDPLKDDNNLGRSVAQGNFFRIKSALSYGFQKLGDVLILPFDNIKNGLENYFKNTIEFNGKGRRADVIIPVPTYGSEISYENSGRDLRLGANHALWSRDYHMMYPIAPKPSINHSLWSHQWNQTGHNVQFHPDVCLNFVESPHVIGHVPIFTGSNAIVGKPIFKPLGVDTLIIPHFTHPPRRNTVPVQYKEENESPKQHNNGKKKEAIKAVLNTDPSPSTPREVNPSPREGTSSQEAKNIDDFNYSVQEFPVLPGIKPTQIKVSPSPKNSKPALTKETSTSLNSSFECESSKQSRPEPGPTLSKTGKNPISDVSVSLDSVSDPTNVNISEDRESSKSEEKMVVEMQSIQLADNIEFPPLIKPPEPVIILTKKEFPPLRSSLKSHRKNKHKNGVKEVPKRV